MARHFTDMLKPSVVLYLLKAVATAVIAIPILVFINGKFSLANVTDNFWPIPSHEALVAFSWQSREIMYVVVPLLFVVGVVYFITLQFFYGGIYDYFLKGMATLASKSFFQACGQSFRGFIKIALASLPIIFVVFLAAEFIGLFLGKIVALIAGQSIGTIAMIFFVIMCLYLFIGYLVVLRIWQAKNETYSLRLAVKSSADIFKTKLRYFLALNIILGILTFAVLSLAIYLFSFIYKLDFNLLVLLFVLLLQQVIILIGSFFEALQIKVNMRLFEETSHGIEVE